MDFKTETPLSQRLNAIRSAIASRFGQDRLTEYCAENAGMVWSFNEWDMWDMWGSKTKVKDIKHRNSSDLGSTQLVIIQATPFCNIDCQYCYLPNRNSTKKISESVLEAVFNNVFSSPYTIQPINFVWHTGEPLVMPPAFYAKAFQLMDKANINKVPVFNSFQTNGTLLNQEWCDFIKANNIEIGISLDGPEFLHNSKRVDRKGRGTFLQTIRGIDYLRQNDIEFGVIMVLTKEALDYPDEVWNFFIENDIMRICFNVEEIEGVNIGSSLQAIGVKEKYKNFFRKMIELNQSRPDVSIRELSFFFESLVKASAANPILSTENHPYVILSFDCEGNMSTFSPELLTMTHDCFDSFTYGNVRNTAISQIKENALFKKIYSEIQIGVKNCEESCEYFEICGGGPPVNKLYENGSFTSTETVYCNLKVKALADVVLEHLEEKYLGESIEKDLL